jgi:DNA-binding response OmpR family regulator
MRAIHAGASKVSEPVLPSRAPPKWPRYPALRLVGQPVAAPQRSFGVLLVDDNPHHRIPLLRALRDQGHRVLHAADGASGETLCRASQLEIDALVACADMKRMCGCELARRVVRMRPEVRVLLMWRHFAGPEAACRAYDRGYAVIEEPFTPEELCRRLTGLLALLTQRGVRRARLDGEDRLILREGEVLAIGSKKEN